MTSEEIIQYYDYLMRLMGNEERTKLDRDAVLKALQNTEFYITGKMELPKFPKRKDGGQWIAHAAVVEAGYPMKEYKEASEYRIHGGHRASASFVADGTKTARLYEFDTTLFDNPNRYGFSWELYFKHVIPLLWCIYADIPTEEWQKNEIPSELIANIPALEKAGLIGNENRKLYVKIPVLKKEEYERIYAVIKSATEQIQSSIGKEFSAFVSSLKTPIPKHLTSVPELFRYIDATAYFAMAIVREAHSKGLHLKDVDYCCPPVVMSIE